MSRIFSADEDRLIIGKKAYGNFRICLEGQFKDAYGKIMNTNLSIERFGVIASKDSKDKILVILDNEIAKESSSQGEGDTELMRLCCIQLFSMQDLSNVLKIWEAKKSSYDADSSIEIRLLCGAGLDETKEFLTNSNDSEASNALEAIKESESFDDFMGFSVEEELEEYEYYYSED